MKKIIQLFLLFIVCSPLQFKSIVMQNSNTVVQSVVVVENDVIMGNALTSYGTLCQDTSVYGSPYEGMKVRYVLSKGETVRLREQSHGLDRSWVMIKPANWIRLSTLCE